MIQHSFSDRARKTLISKLIGSILKVLKKLFMIFDGKVISFSFVSSLSVYPVIFSLELNKSLVSLPIKIVITLA